MPHCSKSQIYEIGGRGVNHYFKPRMDAADVDDRSEPCFKSGAESVKRGETVDMEQEPGPPGHHRQSRVGQMTAGAAFELKADTSMTRMKKILHLGALSAAAALYIASTTDASAQNARNCAPRDAVVDRLAEGYGESRQSMGLGANNAVVEVFASDETGTWTITVTTPNGLTCLVASGQSYEELAEALPAKGNDA